VQRVDTMEAIQKRGLNLFRRESAKGFRIESGADVLGNIYPASFRRKKMSMSKMCNDTGVKLMAGLAPCTKLSSIFNPTIGQNNEIALSFGHKEGFSALNPQLEQLLSPMLCAPLQAEPIFRLTGGKD
jgi:hypothetical protein